MAAKALLISIVVFASTACTKPAVLKEKSPITVSAAPPVKKQETPPPPPPKVVVKEKKIEVNDKIHFEFNKAIIRAESFGLLDEIARVINKHKEIKKLRIEGHTDSVGTRAYNLKLSKRRAKAVMDYLTGKGKVDASRLTMDGYGFDKSIASNDTEEGRAKNRRVEFNIIERDKSAGTGGGDGSGDGDTKTPDTKTPDTKTPDTKTPDTKTPDTKKPDAKKPDAKKPQPKKAGEPKKEGAK